MFAQKLDFIMNLTNSQNIDMARAIGVDASLISRLRSGNRGLPKSQYFLPHMCEYLVSQMAGESIKCTAAVTICPGRPWPENEPEAVALLLRWLSLGNEARLESVAQLISSISTLSFPVCPAPEPVSLAPKPPSQRLYYGLAGAKQAVLDFLDLALADGSRRTIYLFSDESAHWMASDEQFHESWALRLKQLISMGCHAKLILNTTRPLDDLLNSMSKWLPIYMTGAVEPYYYPKIRDGVFHRTLFVADGLAALQASSVDGLNAGTLVHMLTEPEGVAALRGEFFSYFGLCKPMIETIFDSGLFYQKLMEHEKNFGTYIYCSISPSLVTMPKRVAERIGYRSGEDRFLQLYKARADAELSRNDGRQLFELICIPSDRQIYEDSIPVGVCAPLGIRNCFYTAQEYAEHLKSVFAYAREHRNYHFALTKTLPGNTLICCKAGEWVIISKCGSPCVSFTCEQPAAVEAMGLYLHNIYKDAQTSCGQKSNLAELMIKLK